MLLKHKVSILYIGPFVKYLVSEQLDDFWKFAGYFSLRLDDSLSCRLVQSKACIMNKFNISWTFNFKETGSLSNAENHRNSPGNEKLFTMKQEEVARITNFPRS